MRVVITGADGLLSAALIREFSGAHGVHPLSHRALDITEPGAVARMMNAERPDVVINGAVYNGVDAAEGDPVRALELNAFAVRELARAARAVSAIFVHYSSDFVFDGETDRPYGEEDRANPQSVYGASKLLGDWFAIEHGAYVLRVESLFGPAAATGRRGSLATIVTGIMDGAEVPVFVDRVVSPTYTPHAARATRVLVEGSAPRGLYHCVNSGHATWAEIAERAAAMLGRPLHAQPLTLQTAGLRARRPRYCALSNAKLAASGWVMPSWEEALADYLRPS